MAHTHMMKAYLPAWTGAPQLVDVLPPHPTSFFKARVSPEWVTNIVSIFGFIMTRCQQLSAAVSCQLSETE
jgi:hypothetical protein